MSYRASDPLEAEYYMTRSFCDHRLEVYAGRQVGFRHHAVKTACGAFNRLEYGAEIEVSARGFEEFYMLEMPLSGGVRIDFGNAEINSAPGQALLLSPGPRFRSRWQSATRQWMLQIDRCRLEQRIARLTHRDRAETPIFDPVINLETAHGRRLLEAFQVLAADLSDGAGDEDDPQREAITDRIIDLILGNVPYLNGRSVVPDRLSATPRHVKRVMEMFHARFSERLSMSVIARETGVSERALYEGFQRHYQKSPYEMLTRVRVEEARRLIVEEGVAASDAARRVGIRHLGRFSSTYRAFFGILPSQDSKSRH
ncbi:AraC family transcriptional regulator [Martelella soudanensis]|uniref:AraC family transcriptional regulator n=1 Tax=unclassified Martelella TaxID=2629616 RepID=UPI0015DFE7D7|nr:MULTISPECIES: AraC family transcriptional regulator [unclassified Martelella]